jgi:glycosyltransferase involved in cell wall biosynthesis
MVVTSQQDPIWCVIPVYNNGETVLDVARECRRHIDHVLVVDDGSTDIDIAQQLGETDIHVLTHPTNQGKGVALHTALAYVRQRGAVWMICLDADGQHHPEDLAAFLPKLQSPATSIVIGVRDFSVPNVPFSSRFGRQFSNFWVRLECGARVTDSQSGFRAYPVDLILQMKLRGKRYDFEVEVLPKAVWHGLTLEEVPIHVTYLPKEERISHFDKWHDNLLLSHRHGMIMSRRILPWPLPRLVPYGPTHWRQLLRNPRAFLSMLLKEKSTPVELGFSAGVGILLGVLPLIFVHTIAIVYVTTKLKLNRLLAVSIQHLCAPPFLPLICIQLGFFIRNGSWIGRDALRTVATDLHQHLFNWLLGSLLLAPALAVVAALTTFGLATGVQRRTRGHA